MSQGTYGLAKPLQLRSRSPGLMSAGNAEQAAGTQMLGSVARQETQRNITNQQLDQEAKAGKAQLGSTVGTLAGGALASGMAASAATTAAVAGGATAAAGATAGAQAGTAAGPWGMLIGAAIGAIAGRYLF
jgi:hypothetical protein